MQSLSELKAQNEAEELARQNAAQEIENNDAVEEPEVEEEQKIESSDEIEGVEQESEVEEWQKEDGEIAPMFTSRDVSAAKKNLRAKLERRHESEVEELKAKIEALEQQKAQPQKPVSQPRPKYSDFNTDEEFEQAMEEWHDRKIDAKLSGRDERLSQEKQRLEAQQRISGSVDQHYERAAKLTQEHGINQEVYQSADLAVRQMVENIRPGQGDMVVDYLISNLGQDSEKVMYYVGRNANALNELQSALIGDQSGIQAAILLGSMKARVAMPNKRQSKAPKPATQLKGDEAVTDKSSLERKLKKKYQEAQKGGGYSQAAWNARSEARRAGIDVSNWS
jgi:hypothetical protein